MPFFSVFTDHTCRLLCCACACLSFALYVYREKRCCIMLPHFTPKRRSGELTYVNYRPLVSIVPLNICIFLKIALEVEKSTSVLLWMSSWFPPSNTQKRCDTNHSAFCTNHCGFTLCWLAWANYLSLPCVDGFVFVCLCAGNSDHEPACSLSKSRNAIVLGIWSS